MRGTLHLRAGRASLRPILEITGPRIMQRAATRHRDLEIDDEVYARARVNRRSASSAGDASLSRDELFAAWESAGIRRPGSAGYHLIWWLAQESVVCCGPVEGRGQRFVLLDEWAPSTGRLPDTRRDAGEPLRRLRRRPRPGDGA